VKTLVLKGVIGAVLLPFICLISFYLLAVHMYLSLGGWPSSIGDAGLSQGLKRHADLHFWWLRVAGFAILYVWPVVFVLAAVISKARRFVPYLVICALAAVLCYGLTLRAPAPFLYWWRD